MMISGHQCPKSEDNKRLKSDSNAPNAVYLLNLKSEYIKYK